MYPSCRLDITQNISLPIVEKVHSLFFLKPSSTNVYTSFLSPKSSTNSRKRLWESPLSAQVIEQSISLLELMRDSDYSQKRVFLQPDSSFEQTWGFCSTLAEEIYQCRELQAPSQHKLLARLVYSTQDIRLSTREGSFSQLYFSHKTTKDVKFWSAALSLLVEKMVAESTTRPIPSRHLFLSKVVDTNGASLQRCLSSSQIQTVLEAAVEDIGTDGGRIGVGGLRISGEQHSPKVLLKPGDLN